MEVTLNGTRIDDVAAEGETLRQALLAVQSRHCDPSHLVVAVACDGEIVSQERMEAALTGPASSFERIDITTSTPEALVFEAMNQASVSLAATESTIQNVADLFTQGQTNDAIQSLGQCLRVWQQVHAAVAQSIQMLGVDPGVTTIRDASLTDAIAMPKDVLRQVKSALEAQDHVLLADILQYEFSEVTEQWHDIIARLRQEAEDRRDGDGDRNGGVDGRDGGDAT